MLDPAKQQVEAIEFWNDGFDISVIQNNILPTSMPYQFRLFN